MRETWPGQASWQPGTAPSRVILPTHNRRTSPGITELGPRQRSTRPPHPCSCTLAGCPHHSEKTVSEEGFPFLGPGAEGKSGEGVMGTVRSIRKTGPPKEGHPSLGLACHLSGKGRLPLPLETETGWARGTLSGGSRGASLSVGRTQGRPLWRNRLEEIA